MGVAPSVKDLPASIRPFSATELPRASPVRHSSAFRLIGKAPSSGLITAPADLPLNFHPAAFRALASLLCPHSLDHLRLEFWASFTGDGLDAPPELCSWIGVF